jgi:hypothetical protein
LVCGTEKALLGNLFDYLSAACCFDTASTPFEDSGEHGIGEDLKEDLLGVGYFSKPRKTDERKCNQSTIHWAHRDKDSGNFPAFGLDYIWPGTNALAAHS